MEGIIAYMQLKMISLMQKLKDMYYSKFILLLLSIFGVCVSFSIGTYNKNLFKCLSYCQIVYSNLAFFANCNFHHCLFYGLLMIINFVFFISIYFFDCYLKVHFSLLRRLS